MWSSIGSLRESAQRKLTTVRENAIAAAQVAQEVLVTAATEETDVPYPNNNDSGEWEEWPAPSHQENNNLVDGTPFSRPENDFEPQSDQWPHLSNQPADATQSTLRDPPPQPPSQHASTFSDSIPPPPTDFSAPGEPVPPPPDAPPPDEFHFSAPLAPNLQGVSFSKKRPSRYVVAGGETPVAKHASAAPHVSPLQPSGGMTDSSGGSIFPNEIPRESRDFSREQTGKLPSPGVSENFGPPIDHVGATDSLLQIKQLQEEVQRLESMHSSNMAVIEGKNSELDGLKNKVHVLQDEKSALEMSNEESSALNREILELRDQIADSKEDALRTAAQRKALEGELKELQLERDSIHSERDKLSVHLENARTQAIAQETKEADLLSKSEAKSRKLEAKVVELQNALDMVTVERDVLAETQPSTPSNADFTDTDSSMSMESDPKSLQLKTLKKQLKSATSKISKLTAQRNTVMRQRDDAGARLSAAGGEFASLSAKLKKVTASNAAARKSVKDLQSERDEAVKRIEEQATINSELQARIDEFAANLTETQTGLQAAEDARTAAESNLRIAEDEVVKVREELAQREELHRVAMEQKEAIQEPETAMAGDEFGFDFDAGVKEDRSFDFVEQVGVSEIKANLAETEARLQAAEEAKLLAENNLTASEAEIQRLNETISINYRDLEEAITQNQELSAREENHLQTISAMKEFQIEMNATTERLEEEKNLAIADLEKERGSVENTNVELERTRESLMEKDETLSIVRSELEDSLRKSEQSLGNMPVPSGAESDFLSFGQEETLSDISSLTDYAFVHSYGKIHQSMCSRLAEAVQKLTQNAEGSERLRAENVEILQKLEALENQVAGLSEDLTTGHATLQEKDMVIQTMEMDKGKLEMEIERLRSTGTSPEENSVQIESLQAEKDAMESERDEAKSKVAKLENDLEELGFTLAQERSTRDAFSSDEKKKLEDQISFTSTHMESLWTLCQQSLKREDIAGILENVDRDDDSSMNTTMLVVDSLRILSAELIQHRIMNSAFEEKISGLQKELDAMWTQAKTLEGERDAAKEICERLEREAEDAQESGFMEANEEAELQIRQLMEQLEHSREDVTILQDSLEKVETENSSIRGKYNNLKSKQNETTRELEDAEENVAYFQDEISGLKEDLEKARAELDGSRQHESGLEQQLLMIRDEKDKSQNNYREIQLIMETHKTAEENLQIALEQLEAEQATIIKEKTRELEEKLAETISKQESMAEKVAEANAAINQLSLRDEEIQELRTALGRLSDERVELKLELEKSMSRLNTSGSGGVGQLVDRRVIRQLLVNYFRVGTARRRDVLELMSRMLVFSERDLVTVGLKRVNITERIGSMLQAPELDGNSLPPIGNVSDKWIEFLMKESIEEEEDF